MSLIVEFSIFPLDKGQSVGAYVARAVKIIEQSGLPFTLGPMGTNIEGELDEVMDAIKRCFEDLKTDCDRVYFTVKADYRKGKEGRMAAKVASARGKA